MKDDVNYNDYDPCNTSKQHKLRKRKKPPITYNDDDLFVSLPKKQQEPKFISCLNRILFRVLSHNESQKILGTSRTDLQNMMLLQGLYFSSRLWQMSKVFTHDTLEQALLQEPKALEFVKTLHRLYSLLSRVLIPPTHIATPEV